MVRVSPPMTDKNAIWFRRSAYPARQVHECRLPWTSSPPLSATNAWSWRADEIRRSEPYHPCWKCFSRREHGKPSVVARTCHILGVGLCERFLRRESFASCRLSLFQSIHAWAFFTINSWIILVCLDLTLVVFRTTTFCHQSWRSLHWPAETELS